MRRCLTVIAVLLAATVVDVAPAGARAPSWQTVPGSNYEFQIAWAAGRAWLIADDGPGTGPYSDRIVIHSGHVVNGRLRSWVTKKLGNADRYLQVLGNDLLYARPDGTLRSVHLNSNGTLGESTAVAGAPADGAPPVTPNSVNVRLPDRVVWIVEEPETLSTVRRFGCCNVDGAAVDYSSFLPPQARTWGYTLARDGSGRLWYVWIQGSRQETARVKVIELDPATLMPIGVPALAPLPPWAYIVGMPCANACYLVTESSRAKASSWRLGDSSATRIPTPTKSTRGYAPADVFAAGLFAGRLKFAYWADSTERGVRVRLARGNARGAHPRILRSIFDPNHMGNDSYAMGTPRGVLWPGGLVVFQQFQDFSSSRMFLRAAVLH
jgi:hypothetical protein